MANWLLDYIEMTEYIPIEFRDQSFLMRELDLQVSNKMSRLEEEIKDFFSKFDKLNAQERQDQYDALLKKCDEATQAASDKIRLADRLHDLVEKSMRLLDQGLEKLKEDLIEGDKGYIVEDIERRSLEIDQQLRYEEDNILRRNPPNKASREPKSIHSKNSVINHAINNHRHSISSNHNTSHHYHNTSANDPHYRSRNHSTSALEATNGQRLKNRERKRLTSTMTIFNRNSTTRTDDESTNQTFLSSPSTPEYLVGLHNSSSNSLNDVSGGDNSSLTLKGIISGNRNPIAVLGDKINGNDPILVKARQPILTAIDAAHAVSPNATNSDRLILFPGQPNGEIHNNTDHIKQNIDANYPHQSSEKNSHQQTVLNVHNQLSNQLGNHLLSRSNHSSGQNLPVPANFTDQQGSSGSFSSRYNSEKKSSSSYATLPISSRHDPLYLAASQAINATQNMTSGRRTSSLKASYAAVNSGRIRSPTSNNSVFDQPAMTGEVYCKCRGTKHDPNMIACDNNNCKIEWFHYECVGITTPPDGEWYCDDCKASTGFKSSNSKHLKRTHEIPAIDPAATTTVSTPTKSTKSDTTSTSTLWGR